MICVGTESNCEGSTLRRCFDCKRPVCRECSQTATRFGYDRRICERDCLADPAESGISPKTREMENKPEKRKPGRPKKQKPAELENPTPPAAADPGPTPAANANEGVKDRNAAAGVARSTPAKPFVRCRNLCADEGRECDCRPLQFIEKDDLTLPDLGDGNRIGRLADVAFESGYFGPKSPAQLAIQILAGDSLDLHPAQALFDLDISSDGRVLWKGGRSYETAKAEIAGETIVGVDPAAPEGSKTSIAIYAGGRKGGKSHVLSFPESPSTTPPPAALGSTAEPEPAAETAEGPRDDENRLTAWEYGTTYSAAGDFLGYIEPGSRIDAGVFYNPGPGVLNKPQALKLAAGDTLEPVDFFRNPETPADGDSRPLDGPAENAALPGGEPAAGDPGAVSGETRAEINEPDGPAADPARTAQAETPAALETATPPAASNSSPTPEPASAAEPAEYPGDKTARLRIDFVLTDLEYGAEKVAAKLAEFDKKTPAEKAIALRQANTLHRDKLRIIRAEIQKQLEADGKPTVESQAGFFMFNEVPLDPEVWTYKQAKRVLTTLGEPEPAAA